MKGRPERADSRDFEPVEDPGDAQTNDDQQMEPAPWEAVQSKRNVRSDRGLKLRALRHVCPPIVLSGRRAQPGQQRRWLRPVRSAASRRFEPRPTSATAPLWFKLRTWVPRICFVSIPLSYEATRLESSKAFSIAVPEAVLSKMHHTSDEASAKESRLLISASASLAIARIVDTR